MIIKSTGSDLTVKQLKYMRNKTAQQYKKTFKKNGIIYANKMYQIKSIYAKLTCKGEKKKKKK